MCHFCIANVFAITWDNQNCFCIENISKLVLNHFTTFKYHQLNDSLGKKQFEKIVIENAIFATAKITCIESHAHSHPTTRCIDKCQTVFRLVYTTPLSLVENQFSFAIWWTVCAYKIAKTYAIPEWKHSCQNEYVCKLKKGLK